jgi:hypothetical protein
MYENTINRMNEAAFRWFATLMVLGLAGVAAGPANGASDFVETWDSGTAEGWVPATAFHSVTPYATGGNPGGYLNGTAGTSHNAGIVAAYKPEASGDFAGLCRLSVDLRLNAGTPSSVFFRMRYLDSRYNGWIKPIDHTLITSDWTTFDTFLDPTWSDAEAIAEGWQQESNSPSFAETLANVYALQVRCYGDASISMDYDNFVLAAGADTPSGTDVTVEPKDPRRKKKKAKITFENVTKPGKTSVITEEVGPEPPAGYKEGNPRTYYNIKTTAEYEGTVKLEILYDDIAFEKESAVRLQHRKKEEWKDITTSVDEELKLVEGVADSLSIFALFEAADPCGLIADLIGDVMALNIQQGIQNSFDAKLNAALGALDDVNENNDVAAINTLEAFINAVEAQRGDKISQTDADALIAAAQQIIDLLNAP